MIHNPGGTGAGRISIGPGSNVASPPQSHSFADRSASCFDYPVSHGIGYNPRHAVSQ